MKDNSSLNTSARTSTETVPSKDIQPTKKEPREPKAPDIFVRFWGMCGKLSDHGFPSYTGR